MATLKVLTMFFGGLGMGVLSLSLATHGYPPILTWAALMIGGAMMYGSLFIWIRSWNT